MTTLQTVERLAGAGAEDQGKKFKKGKADKRSRRIKDMYQLGSTSRELFFLYTSNGDISGNRIKLKEMMLNFLFIYLS